MLNFAESGHPVFRATSALERGELRSKGKGQKSIHFNCSEENFELILRTFVSVNQFSVYGAVADLCRELARNSRGTGKPAANENLESMEIPTELPTADPQTIAELQGNLLQDYEHKFEQLPEVQKLSKLCSDAGLKIVDKGQFFITLDDDALDDMKGSCRKFSLPPSEESSHVRRWIRGNTKIGPVPDVEVCYHQGRYGVEIMIESLFRDRTVSWVRIVERNRQTRDRNVRNHFPWTRWAQSCRETCCEGKAQLKPAVTLSPISIPIRERKWIDVEPGTFSQGSFEVSKFLIRLLRHDVTVHREGDGAVRFDDSAELFKSRFAGTSHWSTEAWISFQAKRGGPKKRFQYCLNPHSSKPHSCISEQSRDIQEVISLILHYKTMYCCRTTSPRTGPGAMLYVFEENEAVIEMTIKGRSPTMSTCQEPHRVANGLDVW